MGEAHRHALAVHQLAAATQLHGLQALNASTLNPARVVIHDLGGDPGGLVTTASLAPVVTPGAHLGVPVHFPVITATSGLVRQSPHCPAAPPRNSHYARITDYFCVDASSA